MSDMRKVSLDIGAPGTASAGADGAASQPRDRGEADPGLAEQFRSKLAGPPQADAAQPPAPMARPFDLFASGPPQGPAPGASARLAEAVEQAAARVLVSAGGGAGEGEVRIQLKDDVLAGTEVRLTQREGRLEVAFVSDNAQSAAWLAAQSESIAGELARRLRRDVRIAVKTAEAEGETILAQQEAGDASSLPAGPASLFATRMPANRGGDDEGGP
ncbi:MAG TPA: type III secretion HpaP family protein [Usitatibacter sp.]|nr:type III secretion HpaP family protein [Usitatibacter sp.]